MLVIHPDECIDCGVCEPECPVDAIVPDTELTSGMIDYLEFNRSYSAVWPNITESKPRLNSAPSSQNALVRAEYIRTQNCSPEKIWESVNDKSPVVRQAVVLFKASALEPKHVDSLLADTEPSVRAAVAESRILKLTPKQLQTILNDSDPNVRKALLSRGKLQVNHIEKLLADREPIVRRAVVECDDTTLTPQQIRNGLNDADPAVQIAFLARCYSINPKQFEFGLTNKNANVRIAYAKREDCALNDKQLIRGLRDEQKDVVLAFLSRLDWFMTWEDLARSFEHAPHSGLLNLALDRHVLQLSAEQISQALRDYPREIRQFILTHPDITLSDEQIAQALKDHNATCRAAAASLSYFQPTLNQIERGLADDYAIVRRAFAKRTDIPLKQEQIKKGLQDKSSSVRLAFARRPDSGQPLPRIKSKLTDPRLEKISIILHNELQIANGRLEQPLLPTDVLSGLRRIADLPDGACLLLQPGSSGYAWSERIVPLVFFVRIRNTIRVRVRRGKSHRSSGQTPAIWPELRGFPRGNVASKLKKWSEAQDGDTVSVAEVQKFPATEFNCSASEWSFPLPCH